MGTTHGSISLQLETQTCIVGAEIIGVIHILLESEFKAASLKLRLRGEEKTHWTTRSKNRTNNHGSKHKLIDSAHQVPNWSQDMAPGHYSIPFSYVLPTGVPGSFHYSAGTTSAEVIYKLQAVLTSSDDKTVKGKLPVFLKQHSNFVCTSNINLEKEAHMTTWCCRKEGICRIKVNCMQDTYTPTQVARFHVEVDNSDSKLRVNGISCRLIYEIRMKGMLWDSHYVKGEAIRAESGSKIECGDKLLNCGRAEFNLELSSHVSQMMGSYKGDIIECLYSSEIIANMDGNCMCCGEEPTIKSTVNIVPDFVIPPTVPVAPQHWNPLLLDRINFRHF